MMVAKYHPNTEAKIRLWVKKPRYWSCFDTQVICTNTLPNATNSINTSHVHPVTLNKKHYALLLFIDLNSIVFASAL